jgi:hypothetical protein
VFTLALLACAIYFGLFATAWFGLRIFMIASHGAIWGIEMTRLDWTISNALIFAAGFASAWHFTVPSLRP